MPTDGDAEAFRFRCCKHLYELHFTSLDGFADLLQTIRAKDHAVEQGVKEFPMLSWGISTRSLHKLHNCDGERRLFSHARRQTKTGKEETQENQEVNQRVHDGTLTLIATPSSSACGREFAGGD